ncbi:MFS general substrate transporter [Trametes meyenii]|nr:MFS general substrate transporter [Trametes meyenii]
MDQDAELREAFQRRRSMIHFLALSYSMFVNGWNDATSGPLIPRIQQQYNLGFAIVSLILVFNAVGFLSGAVANVYLTDWLGFGKVLVLGSLFQTIAYAMLAPAGPFPLMYFAFFCIGLSLVVQAASVYAEVMADEGETNPVADGADTSKFKQMMGNKQVHFLSVFALIYVGIEVTIGGWSVTYILEERRGNANSGYISAGFFGGKKIGERRALFLYALLVIGLKVTVWVVPSLIENALAVAFVGLLLGPMWPILMNHSAKILPRWLLTACAGYIAGAGQAGSAILSFINGLLASRFGITTLHPFIVSMMSTLLVLWAIIPRARYIPT